MFQRVKPKNATTTQTSANSTVEIRQREVQSALSKNAYAKLFSCAYNNFDPRPCELYQSCEAEFDSYIKSKPSAL